MSTALPALVVQGVSVGGVHDESSIPFIDDSGSSSCASSLLGDPLRYHVGHDSEDDAISITRLLDDAASREFSLSGLQEDLEYHSPLPEGEDGDLGSLRRSSCSKSSPSPSPTSRRTSKSSIKSSDAIDDDPGGGEPPSLPPPLPPCATCGETSSSCSVSSSVLSCTTCAADSDSNHGHGRHSSSAPSHVADDNPAVISPCDTKPPDLLSDNIIQQEEDKDDIKKNLTLMNGRITPPNCIMMGQVGIHFLYSNYYMDTDH